MQVIPVVDVKNGVVVHARGGQRHLYRPIRSSLTPGSMPADVARALVDLFPFSALYVADLDAIATGVPDFASVSAIAAACPDLELWCDAGTSPGGEGQAGGQPVSELQRLGVRQVIGTESLGEAAQLGALIEGGGPDAMANTTILSLDFKSGRPLGADLYAKPELWPPTVIVMTLDHVGAQRGPHLDLITQTRLRARPGTRIVAAGGVRDAGDLVALWHAGADAALVATALHTGTLKAGDLLEIAGLRRTSHGS